MALLVAMVVTAYCMWPALTGPFIFDDFPNLQNMRHLNAGVTRESLGQYLVSAKGVPGRPLAMLSFLIEDSAWPAYPADYKRNNLFLHLLVGLLILWLALKLAKLTALTESRRTWAALLCATAWLINPMQLSSTMLVVQRMNILSTLFILIGLLTYLACLEMQRVRPLARVLLAGVALALFGGLAVLCKENGVLIFAFATALNVTLLRSKVKALPVAARSCLLAGAAAPIVLLIALALLNWDAIRAPYEIRSFTLWERVITQPRILFDYLGNIFLPRIGGQGILHDDYPFSRGLLDPPATLIAIVALAAAMAAAVLARRRAPLAAFAVLWFLAGHLIESSVVGLELYFEHRNYLPMVGPLFAVAVFAAGRQGAGLRVAVFAASAWLLASAFLTRLNAETWGSRGLQSQVWLAEHPKSQRAVQWAASYHFESGDTELGRSTLQSGIERIPDAYDLRLQIVLLDCISRGIGPEQWNAALNTMRSAAYSHLHPVLVGAFVTQHLGPACHGTLDRAMTFDLAEALLANPAYQRHPDALSHIHYELSRISARERDLDGLMHRLDLAYQYNPFPSFPREQAIHLLSAGLPEQALEYLEKSNSTPLPLIKRLLLDVPSANQGLVDSANAMLTEMNAPADANTPNRTAPSEQGGEVPISRVH